MGSLEPNIEDAFGRALLARVQGRDGVAIIERDDGFIEADRSDYLAALSDDDDELWRWIHPRVGQRIVDIGAGAGRASVALQGEGKEVCALDVSPGALDVCRQRGIAETFLGTIDDLAATSTDRFDTFLGLGANLGLIGRDEHAATFFGAVDRLRGPEVRLVGTILDPYVTEVPAHLAYHEANRAADRPAGTVRLRVRFQMAATPWFELRWASPEELDGVARSHGWGVVDVHMQGAAYAAELRPER